MTEKDLMKAMGDIKDEYIEEAAPGKQESGKTGTARGTVYKYVRVLSAMAAVVLLFVSYGIYRNMPKSEPAGMSTTTNESSSNYGMVDTESASDTACTTEEAMDDDMSYGASDAEEEACAEQEESIPSNTIGIDTEKEALRDTWTTVEFYLDPEEMESYADIEACEEAAGMEMNVGGELPGFSVANVKACPESAIWMSYESKDGQKRYGIGKANQTAKSLSSKELLLKDIREVMDREISFYEDRDQNFWMIWEDEGYRYCIMTEGFNLSDLEVEDLVIGLR